MFEDRTKVLLILAQDVVDRARVVAGRMTTALKLPVSLQIVFRALIEEGLKQQATPVFIARVEGHAQAVRRLRSSVGRRARTETRPARTRAGRLK